MIMAARVREGWHNFVFCDEGRVVIRKSDWGVKLGMVTGICGMWKIISTTHVREWRISHISVLTFQSWNHIFHIRYGKFFSTGYFLKSQYLLKVSPISFYLSLSHSQLYHYLKTWCPVIPLYLSISWLWVHTKYSIHQLQHTPISTYTNYSIHQLQHTPITVYTKYTTDHAQHKLSRAYTEYSSHRIQPPTTIDCLPLPASLSSLIFQYTILLYSTLYIRTNIY